jgi:hypothetical protein
VPSTLRGHIPPHTSLYRELHTTRHTGQPTRISMVVHRMLRLLLLGLLGAQVLCVKPKWRESGDPRAVTHPSGRHHSYSIHEAAKKGNIDEVHRHIEIHGRKAVHFKDDDVRQTLLPSS